jgi:polysulfide reductase chain C
MGTVLAEAPRSTADELRAQLSPALLARAVGPPRDAEQQQAWELLIAGYLYLGGLGAGAFFVATVAAWLGLEVGPAFVTVIDGRPWDWSKLLVLWGPAATALGASLLVFHLGRNWWRFWSAGFNPRTSWMARGFSILLAFIVLGALVAAVAVVEPAWPDRAPVLWRGLEAVAAASALGTAVYTGILLQSMQPIPAWRPAVLPLLFLVSALSTGSMGVALGAVVYGSVVVNGASGADLVRGIDSVEPFLIAAEAALLAVYVRRLRLGVPAARLSAEAWLSGRWRAGFWGGIVGLALLLPFVLVLVNAGLDSTAVTVAAALSVLLGGFLLRCGVLAIGVPEAPPLDKLARWRARRPLAVPARPLPEAEG